MKNRKTLRLTELALFTALVILMSFTPLGYFRTAGLEITLLCIPVAVGAAVLGKKAGAFLGGIFGVTSFIQCLTGLSPFGAMLLSINWLGSFMVCVPTRILAGFVAGLLADLILGRKDGDDSAQLTKKGETAASFTASLAMPLLNTLLFMGTLIAFFWKTDYIQGFAGGMKVLPFVIAFVGINGLIEVISCLVIGTAVSMALFAVRDRMGK